MDQPLSGLQGRVYVGDRENERAQVFDPNGKIIAQ